MPIWHIKGLTILHIMCIKMHGTVEWCTYVCTYLGVFQYSFSRIVQILWFFHGSNLPDIGPQ